MTDRTRSCLPPKFYVDNDALVALGLSNAPAPGTTVQIVAEVVTSDIWWRSKIRIVRLREGAPTETKE